MRFKVFISSVQREFAAERQILTEYIRKDALLGKFFDVFLFEEEPACDVEARGLYLPEVERSDVYLGILGAQFGNADADGVSPTEREYDLATAKGKERLVFVKNSTPSQIRTKEAEFVLREAFQIVKSEQTENSSLTLTMAAGDFNRSAKSLQAIAAAINAMPMRSDKMQIGVTKNANEPDAHLTTIAVSNKDEVKNGKAREYKYSHDYDHFAFDMDVWSPSDAKRAFGLEYEKFFVLEGNERRALSDHLPVVIKTLKF